MRLSWENAFDVVKCATLNKMRHTWRNAARVRQTWKNAAHLEKCDTLGKVQHAWKSAAHLEKCGTLGKVRHTWKSAAHLEKCDTLGKVRHIWKSAAHLEKCGTLGKVRYTWKSAAHLEKCATLGKRRRTFSKRGAFFQVCRAFPSVPHFSKCAGYQNFTVLFLKCKRLKLNLRVFLAGHSGNNEPSKSTSWKVLQIVLSHLE